MTINLPFDNLAAGLKNKHVSIPMITMALSELIQIINPAWYAAHQAQIHALQKWAIAYAAIFASVTGPIPSNGNPKTQTQTPPANPAPTESKT